MKTARPEGIEAEQEGLDRGNVTKEEAVARKKSLGKPNRGRRDGEAADKLSESVLPIGAAPEFALADGRTRPEFMLVGGMKCGSTSFARYLSVHPQVKLSGPKEPHYWSWHRYPAQYQDFFVNESPVSDPGPGQGVSGEFSTSSLIHPLAPRRVRSSLPTLKIFVLLRNPVDRAYSHFMMSKSAGLEEACSFPEIVRREIDEVSELLAAHERGFLDRDGEARTGYSTTEGTPIHVAKHEQGWPARILRSDLDLRDFYFRRCSCFAL